MTLPSTTAGSPSARAAHADRWHFADFTRENYRRLLRLAKETWTFRTFADFRRDERFTIWRHDVDLSVHAARQLARIEAEEGVRTTYLIHLHSDFYNALEPGIRTVVHEILEMGHALGLHFDSHFYGIEDARDLEAKLAFERRVLHETFGREPEAFSFHIATPFTMRCREWSYAGMVHAHASYFQEEVGYCSDSNGYWRHRRLEDVLREAAEPRLQVLTHPEWWQDEVRSPRERVLHCTAGRSAGTLRAFEAVLAEHGRPLLDWDDGAAAPGPAEGA